MQINRTGNAALAYRPAGLRILLIVQTNRLGMLFIARRQTGLGGILLNLQTKGTETVLPADHQD